MTLRVPGGTHAVLVSALVDTGADLCTIPDAVAREIGLPPLRTVLVSFGGPASKSATVYAAEAEVDGVEHLVEVLGLEGEALAGRNLLNRWRLTLDGPRGLLDRG